MAREADEVDRFVMGNICLIFSVNGLLLPAPAKGSWWNMLFIAPHTVPSNAVWAMKPDNWSTPRGGKLP